MRNPKNEIMLVNTDQGIMCHFLNYGEPDKEIVSLFGTHIIPSAFTGAGTMQEAAKVIEKKNPGYVVSIV